MDIFREWKQHEQERKERKTKGEKDEISKFMQSMHWETVGECSDESLFGGDYSKSFEFGKVSGRANGFEILQVVKARLRGSLQVQSTVKMKLRIAQCTASPCFRMTVGELAHRTTGVRHV